jgi:hypothetical protein
MNNQYKFLLFLIIQTISGVSNQKSCTSFIPNSKEECSKFNDAVNYCCYYTNENKFYDHCDFVNAAAYLTMANTTMYSGMNFTMNCGANTQNNLKKCGIGKESSQQECSKFSSNYNSCCYYNHYGTSGCVMTDSKISGAYLNGNVILECYNGIIKYSIMVSLFIVLIVLF